MKIRVLIAEDNESIRKWYQVSLQEAEDIDLLPMAANGYEAISLAARYHPDVVILDIEMECKDAGIMAGYQILAMNPETKIIMLTVHEEEEVAQRMRAEFRRLKQSEHTMLNTMKMVQQLSHTERSIVIMLAEGMRRSEICRQRVIEMSTLKTHIRSILQKFQVKSTRQLVELVKSQNLLSFLELCEKEEKSCKEEE